MGCRWGEVPIASGALLLVRLCCGWGAHGELSPSRYADCLATVPVKEIATIVGGRGMDDLQRAANPLTTAAELQAVASRSPAARPLVAMHPNAYPDLLAWLASLGDPAVTSALARRSGGTQGLVEDTLLAAKASEAGQPSAGTVASSATQPGDATLAAVAASDPRPDSTPTKLPAGLSSQATKRRRRTVPVVIGLVVGLLLAGGAAAVFIPRLTQDQATASDDSSADHGSADPAESESAAAEAADAEPATFLDGGQVSWTLDASDVLPPGRDGMHAAFSIAAEVDEMIAAPGGSLDEVNGVWVVAAGYTSGWEGIDSLPSTSTLVGIDTENGEVIWRFDGEQVTGCVPVAEANLVACSSYDSESTVGIDVETGEEIWRTPSSGLLDASNGVVGYQDLKGVGAMDGATGRDLWRVEAVPLPAEVLFLEVRGELLASAFEDGERVYDLRTGDLLAEVKQGSVTLLEDRALMSVLGYVESDAIIYNASKAVQVEDMDSSPDYVVESLGGTVWVEYDDTAVWSRDVASGEYVWRVERSAQPVPGAATIARGDAERIVLDADGAIITVNPSVPGSGDAVVSNDPSWVTSSPDGWSTDAITPLDDGVVAISQDGRVGAFDGFTGEALWEMDIPGAAVSFPPRGELAVISTDHTTLSRIVPGRSAPAVSSAVVLPEDVPECPGDTILLARAELPNGWVLVCGYYAGQPTYMAVHLNGTGTGGSSGTTTTATGGHSGDFVSETVVYDAASGRYTATGSDGAVVWLDYAPATLGWRSAEGVTLAQESVVYIFFVELGEGGEAQGTGDYDVEAPERTAEAQVAYFSEILRRSEAARAELGPAVAAVRECTASDGDYSSQIATIESVRDNRSELLAAIQAAPVDQVPDGTALVDELSAALTASYDADVAYLDWAEDADSNGCDPNGGDIAASYTERAGVTKTTFAEHWNSTIAGEFGVPEVSRESL